MAISEDDRLVLRARLTETLGEREARVLMESVPPVDYDQLATHTNLEHTRSLLSAEIDQLGTQTDAEFVAVRAEFVAVRAEIKSESASIRDEIAQLRLELATGQRRMMVTHIGSMIGLAAFISVT